MGGNIPVFSLTGRNDDDKHKDMKTTKSIKKDFENWLNSKLDYIRSFDFREVMCFKRFDFRDVLRFG